MITDAEIYEIHAIGIRDHGGDSAVLHPGCVEAKLGAALMALEYEGLDPAAFAATLCFYLTKGHCFADGNKRVAWYSARRSLELDGFRVVATAADAESFMVTLGTCEEAISWFSAPGRIAAI